MLLYNRSATETTGAFARCVGRVAPHTKARMQKHKNKHKQDMCGAGRATHETPATNETPVLDRRHGTKLRHPIVGLIRRKQASHKKQVALIWVPGQLWSVSIS